jgi:hypothetical protein
LAKEALQRFPPEDCSTPTSYKSWVPAPYSPCDFDVVSMIIERETAKELAHPSIRFDLEVRFALAHRNPQSRVIRHDF